MVRDLDSKDIKFIKTKVKTSRIHKPIDKHKRIMYTVSTIKRKAIKMAKDKTSEVVKEATTPKNKNRFIKLIELYLAVGCAISAYFLVFVVSSDLKYILWAVSGAPAVVAAHLFYKNWLK